MSIINSRDIRNMILIIKLLNLLNLSNLLQSWIKLWISILAQILKELRIILNKKLNNIRLILISSLINIIHLHEVNIIIFDSTQQHTPTNLHVHPLEHHIYYQLFIILPDLIKRTIICFSNLHHYILITLYLPFSFISL